MLIPWLLKYDGYPPGVVVALLVHGILLYIFMPKQWDPADQVTIQPAAIVAAAVTSSPQQLRRIERRQQAAQQQENARREEQRRQQAAEDQRRAEEQRRQQEADAQRRREEERRQQVAEDQRRAEEQRRQQEANEQARREQERRALEEAEQRRISDQLAAENAARAATVEGQLASQYSALIMQLVSDNWSRPPSATNGMTAVVQIRLVPTGEILDSTIIQSSGNDAFDRSVIQALDRVGSFEFQGMPTAVFERNFRNFTITFRPEDLLR